MNIYNALESLHTTGGFSFNLMTGDLNPKDGFMVVIGTEHEKKITSINRYKKEAVANIVKEYTQSKAALLADGSNYLGAWVDDNTLYLDISEKVEQRLDAAMLCMERKQLAYFDNADAKSIYLSDTTE